MNINYDISHLLGYIGIVATIIFGIWGIYITLKYRNYVKISFVLIKSIALFDTIVKNLSELSVLYNGSPITQNLVLIEGALVNTGTKDILPTIIEKPICLNLLEDYKWLTAKVISASINVKANITISNPTLLINSGLFRLDEYIRFQALLQAPHDDNISNIESKLNKIITISHRIADMPKIKEIRLQKIEIKQLLSVIALYLFLIIFIAIVGYNIATEKPIMQTIYSFKKADNEIISVVINKIKDDNYTIEGVDVPFKQILPSKEFYKTSKRIGEKAEDPFFQKLISVILFAASIGGLIIILLLLRKYKINNKLIRLFALDQ